MLATVLAWLGFNAPKTTSALRGGDSPSTNLWILDADKPVRPARPLKLGRYRSPVFSASGTHVFAIRDGGIADIPVDDSDRSRDLAWPYPDDAPRLLLGNGGDDHASIAVLTIKGSVIALRPSDGRTTELAPSLSSSDIATLVGQLGVCGDRLIYEATQKSMSLSTRTDVFIRQLTSKLGKSLTDKWPGSVHSQPAFSSDCTKVVLVSDER